MRPKPIAVVLLLISSAILRADSKPKPQEGEQPISTAARLNLIRGLNAEFVFVRAAFPMGTKGLVLRNGQLSPSADQVRSMVAQYGLAARPGDRAQITNVEIKDRQVIFELNGGPKKKKKWYQHIEVGGMGGMTPIAPDNSATNPHGSYLALQFDRFVPEMSPDQVKKLLAPVFDFTSLSAAQAYIDTMPPKVREAMKKHEVLVGMNRDMVIYSKGKPPQKVRERDAQGDYEEWIYGRPPEQVEFVRIYGDEVKRVEIMKVDGEKVVRTEPEVTAPPSGLSSTSTSATVGAPPSPGPASGTPAPTLRRPGEIAPANDPATGVAPPPLPADTNPPGQPAPRTTDPTSMPH
jgi:hypothetical protein